MPALFEKQKRRPVDRTAFCYVNSYESYLVGTVAIVCRILLAIL